MYDADRIADYLLDHGSVTSYELSKMGMSGNPSQRIQDIRDKRGWVIDSERFTRTDPHGKKRPCCRYRLVKVSVTDHSTHHESLDDRGADLGQSEAQRAEGAGDLTQVGSRVPSESSSTLGDRSSSPDPQDAAVAEPRQVTDADGSPGRDPSASLLLFDMPARLYEDAA